MAESATLPSQKKDQSVPSAEDLSSQFNAPSYTGADAADNQRSLATARNQARLQQTKDEALSDPLNPNSSDIPQSGRQPGYVGQGSQQSSGGIRGRLQSFYNQNFAPESKAIAPINQQSQRSDKAAGDDSKNPLNTTRKNSNKLADPKADLNDDRNKSRKEKQNEKKKAKRAEIIKNYPHPIAFTTFMIVGTLAVVTDIVSLVLLITGVGEILSWLLGGLFILFYWVFIYYRSPKDPDFRAVINIRQIINFVVEMIPFLGSLWIGNTLVIIYVYIMITSYEAGRFTPPPGAKATSKVTSGKLPR